MHMASNHTTYERVSRRGYHEAAQARRLASVEPCLHITIKHDVRDR
jgi:hypothetical protein